MADNITRTQHKPDRELIGQGIGNTIAGLFGGLPGAGATMRTVVNVNAGGRTPISGALHSLVLLFIVLGAGALASDIPKAVLAGILIKVGTDIIDWDYLKRLRYAPKAGVMIMLTVLFITVFVDLLLAFGVGMVMASFLFMKRMTDMQIANMRPITAPAGEVPLSDQEAEIMKQAEGKILLFHLSGPISFSSAKAMVRRHSVVADYDYMVLDLSEVPSIDFTVALALEDIIRDTLAGGRRIFLTGACEAVYNMLQQQQILPLLDEESIYKNRQDALLKIREMLKT